MTGDIVPFPDRNPEPVPDTVPVEWLDDDDQVKAVPVDPPGRDRTLAELMAAPDGRRPVLPGWLRRRADFRAVAAWAARSYGHNTLYHLLRSPKYALRTALRAPVGAVRTVGALWSWLWDLEAVPVRAEAVRRADADAYLKLMRARNDRVRLRLLVVGVAFVATAVLLLVAPRLVTLPDWANYVIAAALVAALARVGSPADRPLIDRAVVVARAQRLTSDVVVRALSSLQLAGINQALAKDPNAIKFTAPISRDGPGWRADIDLPYGCTFTEVMDRRDKLAAGLGRPLGCVWPEGNTEVHPGRLVLWVGDQDMATTKPASWPLAKTGGVDLFRPFPFGQDPRGRPVPLELVESNLLVGSLPGAGKTAALRIPLLAAALDPRAELWVFELKGSGDLEALELVASRYGSGADDDTIEQALMALRDLRQECTRRAATIKKLPRDLCPEHKVTPQLAARRGLHPLVVAIDECQELFSHKTYGDEAGDLAEKVVKLGRALGVILLLATQRPDKESLPTGVTANVSVRFCLRVMGQIENDLILGTSAYKNGVRATLFTRRDRGVGYLVGAGDDPAIVRTFYVDGPAAHAVCGRARKAREAAGTLEGHALGDEHTRRATYDLLADILAVLTAREAKVWSEALLERLVKLRPDVYGGWSVDQLALALKVYEVATVQIKRRVDGQPVNRRGVVVADLKAAQERRQIGR